MARKNNDYIINHSNYTTKKRHKLLTDSTIFERDYMITTNLGGWGDNFIGYDGANNFKILQGGGENNFRKHSFGKWLEPPTNCSVEGNNGELFWKPCDYTKGSTENTIVPKMDYTSLRNFAYFGNCYQLVTTSIEDIILHFPGELYVTSTPMIYTKKTFNGEEFSYVLGETYHRVDNPFNIDVFSAYIPQEIPEDLRYRYFYASNGEYTVYDAQGKPVNGTWTFTYYDEDGKEVNKAKKDWDYYYNREKCYPNGAKVASASFGGLTLTKCVYDDTFVIMANRGHDGWHIRPSESIINEFFNNLDSFQSFLLNRNTNPKYSIKIDAPYQGEDGSFITPKKTFTWPTTNDWNLELDGVGYSNYINGLLDIATLYDEYYTDNLWRSITHESIKNMEDTFFHEGSNEDIVDYRVGASRMRGLFLAYGRLFDDIKLSADNIRFTSAISYSGNGNMPDYFLTDALELSGWEAYSIKDHIDKTNSEKAVITGFTGVSEGYTAGDASTEFLRILKLNSKNIISKKGTRKGIESILGLFGLLSKDYIDELKKTEGIGNCAWNYDYRIDEYTRVLSGKNSETHIQRDLDGETNLTVEIYNRYKNSMPVSYGEDIITDLTTGLPIAIIEGNTQHATSDGNKLQYRYCHRFMVPWFSKSVEYDGNPWYQMKGGWCKLPDKAINEDITDETQISGVTYLYSDTKKNMSLVKNFNELSKYSKNSVNDGDVFYVYDINDYEQYFGEKAPDNLSHYFIVNQTTGCTTNTGETGYYSEDGIVSAVLHGWDNVLTENGNITDKRVLFVESLIDDSRDNNPHTGYPNYDMGEEFWEYYKTLYKGAIDTQGFTDNAYDCETGELIEPIAGEGFIVNTGNTTDNVKCWYFGDNNQIDKGEETAITYTLSPSYPDTLYDFEQGTGIAVSGHTTGQSYGIMNTKVMKISFNNIYKNGIYKHFIYNAVLPYLKQMVPSTTIWEVAFE